MFNLHVVESNPEVSGCSCGVEAIKDSLHKIYKIETFDTKRKIDAQQQILPESQMLQGLLEARRSHIGHKLPLLLGKSPSRSANLF